MLLKSIFSRQSFRSEIYHSLMLTMLFLVLLHGVSNAQSDEQSDEPRRFIDLAKVSVEASTLTDFAPAGWLIEKQIRGDINFDSKPDAVLQLVESDDHQDEERYRALLVIIRTDNGKWRLIASADRLLAEFSSGGMKCGSAGENIEVKVSNKGVLTVDQCLGGANLITYTHRFRYNAKLKRLALIGADGENGSPASQLTTTSINYLTGTKVTTMFDDDHPKGVTKKERVSMSKTFYIEEIDNENFQESGI